MINKVRNVQSLAGSRLASFIRSFNQSIDQWSNSSCAWDWYLLWCYRCSHVSLFSCIIAFPYEIARDVYNSCSTMLMYVRVHANDAVAAALEGYTPSLLPVLPSFAEHLILPTCYICSTHRRRGNGMQRSRLAPTLNSSSMTSIILIGSTALLTRSHQESLIRNTAQG